MAFSLAHPNADGSLPKSSTVAKALARPGSKPGENIGRYPAPRPPELAFRIADHPALRAALSAREVLDASSRVCEVLKVMAFELQDNT